MGFFLVLVLVFLGGAAVVVVWELRTLKTIFRVRKSIASRGRTQDRREGELLEKDRCVNQLQAHLENKKVAYESLEAENATLKQDLFNLSVQVRKQQRDHAATSVRQDNLDKQAHEVADQHMSDTLKWLRSKITTKNYTSSKDRLIKAIGRCRGIGFDISESREKALIQELQEAYEMAVRREVEREEQARIRAQIREEQRIERERKQQIEDAQRQEKAIKSALEEALARAKDEHDEEVERLRQQLREAEEKSERAISQAQLTKAGHVYVLSNIGSFGVGTFKVGMTRRLEPMDRVKELGDASVPFPFDVHMMISCDDAPRLENILHRELHHCRVNKVNLRKEYFRIDLDTIREVVETHHGEVEYTADADALEYFESESMSTEDVDFLEQTAEKLGIAVEDDE